MNIRLRKFVALAGVLGLLLAACADDGQVAPPPEDPADQEVGEPQDDEVETPTAADGEPYVIGVTGTLAGAGPFALYTGNVEGMRLYFEQLNAQGGINGHPVELVLRENEADPGRAATAARELVDRDINALVIASPSVTFAPIIEASPTDLPIIQIVSGCAAETAPPSPTENFFCVGTAPELLEFVAQYIDEQGGGQVRFIASETPASRFPIERFGVPEAQRLGLEADSTALALSLTQADLGPVTSEIMQGGYDWVVSYAATKAHMLDLCTTLLQQGWEGRCMIVAIGDAEMNLERARLPGLEIYSNYMTFAEDRPVHQAIRVAIDEYGADFDATEMAYGWAAALALHEALEECGFPCTQSDLLEVVSNFEASSEDLLALWGNAITWSPDNHIAAEEAYTVFRWDEEAGAVVVVQDFTPIEIRGPQD